MLPLRPSSASPHRPQGSISRSTPRFRSKHLNCSLDWQRNVLKVPPSSQIRSIGAPLQRNTIDRAWTVISHVSRRLAPPRRPVSISPTTPTSAPKAILKKLAPAFRSLCLYPRWCPFTRRVYEPIYGQPTHNEQLTSSHHPFEPIPFVSPADEATRTRTGAYPSRVTCRRSNSS